MPDLSGVDLAPLPPCPSGSLFCDDFEGENLAFASWNGSMSVGTMITFALNNAHPFLHGSQSLEVHSTGGGFSLRKTLSNVSSGTLAFRFYIDVSAALSGAMPFLYLPNNGSPISVGSQTSGTNWLVATTSNYDGGPIRVGAWQCVEFDLDFGSTQFSLYATDAMTPNRTASPIATGSFVSSTGIDNFYLGIYSAPTSGSADIWFDDIAVAAQHIGCE
jgi:hypothetical protein